MELMLNLPNDLSNIVQYIDRPVLLINTDTKDVTGINQAGVDFFRVKSDLVGLAWPGILALAHVPPETDLAFLEFPQDGTRDDSEGQQTKKLTYIDLEDSSERYLEFKFVKSSSNASIVAVIIIDRTDIESSLRSRADFVTMASHELRTPLSGIKWSVELFIRRYKAELNEDQLHILDNAEFSIRRMNDLIGALLQLSRIETGSLKLKPRRVEIHKLLQEVVEAQGPQAKRRNIQLVTSFHQNLPEIFLDGTLVGYVFENLLTNAIKYSHDDSDVTIFLSKLQDVLLLQVTDSGIGIPHAHQKMIFEKFYRDGNAIEQDPNGTGLGLHLCRIIARRTGGDIWFESEEGKGTTFWFTIPLKGVTVDADGTEEIPSTSSRGRAEPEGSDRAETDESWTRTQYL